MLASACFVVWGLMVLSWIKGTPSYLDAESDMTYIVLCAIFLFSLWLAINVFTGLT